MKLFFRHSVITSNIIETLELPSRGMVSHISNIYIGMPEAMVRKLLKGCILREDRKPFEGEKNTIEGGIDSVISCNAWPEIYRYVLKEEEIISAIIEIGIFHNRFEKIFAKVEEKIHKMFAHSIEVKVIENMRYPIYMWEYEKYFCNLQVINDKIININPLFFDSEYFGHELDGTFIRVPKSRFKVLPTIAVIFSRDKKVRSMSWIYLQRDLAKRSKAISLLNLPTMLEE